MAGKVQLTVKGFYEQDALMTGVVERSPAIARLREQVRGLPEAAGYYKRIELGQLVAAEVERERERDAHGILERLRPLALAARLEPPSTTDSAVHAAFLVDGERVEEFSGAVAALGRELAGRIRLRFLGPLPPYSFSGEDATAGARRMGLITGLLTLPLAPVRGTVWIAERILEQAEAELDDEGAIMAQLMEIDAAREAGEISEQEAAEAEDILLERLIAIRG